MNKIRKIHPLYYTIVIVVFITLLSACSAGEPDLPPEVQLDECYRIDTTLLAEGNAPKVKFELAAPLDGFTDTLPVYEMATDNVTADYAQALAAKFGLEGELSSGERTYWIREVETHTVFEIYKATGTFSYIVFSRLHPEEKPDLPTDEEAMKIATDFLAQRDLLPRGDVASRVISDGGGYWAKSNLLVSFDHAVEITGPGARHGVRIGDGGEVIEVFINPANPLDLPLHAMMKVKSTEQAFEEMKANCIYHVDRETRKVVIDSVSVAYWLEPIDKGQEYVMPVYRFKGRCFDITGKQLEGTFTGLAEALASQ